MYPSMTTYLPSNSGNFGGLSLQICRAPIIHSPPDRRSSSSSLTSVQGRLSTDSSKTREAFLPEIHGTTLQGSRSRPPSKTAVIVRAKSGKLTSKRPDMAFQSSPSVPKFQGSSVSVLVDSAAVKKALESLNLQEHDSGISSEDSNNEHHDSTETTAPTATVSAPDNKLNKNKKKTKRKVKSGSKMANRKTGIKPGLKLKTRAKSAKSIYSQTLMRVGSAVGFNANSLRLQTRQKTGKSDQRVSRTSEATRRDNKMSAPKASSEIIYSQKFSRLHPNSSIHAVSKSLDSAQEKQSDKRHAGFLSARRAEVPMFSPRRADLLPSPRRPSTNGAEEQMERYEFVPSMTDVRAKREVQARLQLMDKAAKQKKAKQMEIAKRQEKRKEKDGVAGHKARQRLEIYALNKIMSEYEWSNFQAFKRSINGGV
ncbi:eukaryotic translation initiation factor 3 subunit A-like isoform X2 [Branchiostoma lanceolatum]|uniref:eukaryotic translation initiation factor 3 subunit A-like isoform X2 n=1 Tax=Branchiostoma lanceolatum TaxID=7740 RepID=UPI003453F35F